VCVLLKISSLLLLLLLCLLLHIHTDFALLSPTQKKHLVPTYSLVGGSGVVRSFAHRKLFRKRGVDKEKRRALLKAQALFSCRLRVVFDTESRRRSESPERFLIPKDSILWILIGNTNAAGVVVLVVFPRARPRCSRRRTTTTRLLLLLLPFRRKRRRRKRRR